MMTFFRHTFISPYSQFVVKQVQKIKIYLMKIPGILFPSTKNWRKKALNSLEATNVKIGGIWDRTGISVTYANRISAGYQHSSTSLTIDKMSLNPTY